VRLRSSTQDSLAAPPTTEGTAHAPAASRRVPTTTRSDATLNGIGRSLQRISLRFHVGYRSCHALELARLKLALARPFVAERQGWRGRLCRGPPSRVRRRRGGRGWPPEGRGRVPAGGRASRHRSPRPTLPLRVECVRKVSPSAAAIPQIAKNRKNPKSADKPGSVTALARYGRHSSRRTVAGTLEPPTRGLGEQRHRPPTWCCSGWRLPRFTRRGVTRGDSSLWPCSSPSSTALTATYRGRALPGIPLCGARTFLPPVARAATVWLASDA